MSLYRPGYSRAFRPVFKMPLSVPVAAESQAAVSLFAERPFFVDSGGSNTAGATDWVWNFISDWNGESSVCCANDNRVARITDLRAKATPFAGQPDAGAGFQAGAPVFETHQAPDGTLYVFFISATAELGVSIDNGATWTPLVRPALTGALSSTAVTANNRFWVMSNSVGVNNLAFSDNQGASWTVLSVPNLGAGGSFGRLLTSRDGNRLVGLNVDVATFVFTTEIDGNPPLFTFIDLQAILGITGGAGSYDGSTFDTEGGLFLGGTLGNFVYTPDFSTFTLIPDSINPLIRGDSVNPVGGLLDTSTVYSPFYDGFICLETVIFGNGAFFPRTDITSGKNVLLVGTATVGVGTGDENGNILYRTDSQNIGYGNLIRDFD